MNVNMGNDRFLSIRRQEGHYYVPLRAVFAGSNIGGVRFWLVLDTGAFVTVISRMTAERFGYDKLPSISSKIKGFTGEATADFVTSSSTKLGR